MSVPANAQALINSWLPGGYRITRFIGAGAFAWVYYAVTQKNQAVAVKVLQADSNEARTLFTREIKILRQLPANRYCVSYVDDGVTDGGMPFLVMEYIDGCTLKDALKFQPVWEVPEAMKFALQLCEALQGLHKYGLAHRDLKPENVMLTRAWEVKLMDFGLVKDAQGLLKLFESEDILEGRDFAENIDKAMLAGTPEYMAPEQFSDPMIEDESLAKTDTWTDVYSMALIFYQLLVGEKLFPFKSTAKDQRGYARELLGYIRSRTEVKDEQLMAPESVPPALWAVLSAALRQNPKQRPFNADALAAKLRQYMDGGVVDEFEDDEHTSVASMSMLMPVMQSIAQQQAKAAPIAKAANAPMTSKGPAMPPPRPPAIGGNAPSPGVKPRVGSSQPDDRTRPVDVGVVQAYREGRLNKPGGPDYTIPPGQLHARDVPQSIVPPAPKHNGPKATPTVPGQRSPLAQTASLPVPLVHQQPVMPLVVHQAEPMPEQTWADNQAASQDSFGVIPQQYPAQQSQLTPVAKEEPNNGMKGAIAFALIGVFALVAAVGYMVLHK